MKKLPNPKKARRPVCKTNGNSKKGLQIMAKSDQTHFAPRRKLKV